MRKEASTPVSTYLASLPGPQKRAMIALCRQIRSAAPEVEEGVSYGLAAFRWRGRPLVAIAGTAKHCALYPMGVHDLVASEPALKAFDVSKGTIRFQPDHPISSAVVRRIVKGRIAEIEEGAARGRSARSRTPRKASKTVSTVQQLDPDVTRLLKKLKHPLDAEIHTLRAKILSAGPSVREAVKWNAPSYRTSEFFATVHVRARDTVQVVLHRGAKRKDNSAGVKIADPEGLLRWLASDRCLANLGAGAKFRASLPHFRKIVRAWMKQL